MIIRARRIPGARLVVGGAALACAAVLVAACGGSSSSSSAPPTADPVTASGSPASSASSPASSSPASPATPATPAAATSPPSGVAGSWSGYATCPHLGVKLGLSERDPGVAYQVVEFTNQGSVTCILDGYPGVSLAAGAAPIGLPAAHNTAVSPKPVTLPRGGVANVLVQITDAHHYAQASCDPVQARYLIIYMPNDTPPVKLGYAATACAKRVSIMQVSAVRLGTGS